jgi:hypothetical protein
MRNSTVLGLALAAVAACAIGILGPVTRADTVHAALATQAVVKAPRESIPDLEPSVAPRTEQLRRYLLTVMQDWPKSVHVPAVAYEDVALSIAQAVDSSPQDGWPAPWNTREARAVLLASLGYFEGARYAEYVDDGTCNRMMKRAWDAALEESTGALSVITGRPMTRKRHPNLAVLTADERKLLRMGTCDNGLAVSIFQIHAADLHLPADKLADRTQAAIAALAIAKRTIAGGLCGYSGEAYPECPKAHVRLQLALEGLRKHPPRELPLE